MPVLPHAAEAAGRGSAWEHEGLFGVYEPNTRTIFTKSVPAPLRVWSGCSTTCGCSTGSWRERLPRQTRPANGGWA